MSNFRKSNYYTFKTTDVIDYIKERFNYIKTKNIALNIPPKVFISDEEVYSLVDNLEEVIDEPDLIFYRCKFLLKLIVRCRIKIKWKHDKSIDYINSLNMEYGFE